MIKDFLSSKLGEINSEAAYILNTSVFENEYELLLNSFKKYYDNVNIAYSFKTNYIPDFLSIVNNKKWICWGCFNNGIRACTKGWFSSRKYIF